MCSPGSTPRYLAEALPNVRRGLGATPAECNGQDDHVHQLAGHPPKVPASALVNSPNGVSARKIWQRYPIRTHREHLWSPSYLAASCGSTPLSIIKQHTEQPRTPGR